MLGAYERACVVAASLLSERALPAVLAPALVAWVAFHTWWARRAHRLAKEEMVTKDHAGDGPGVLLWDAVKLDERRPLGMMPLSPDSDHEDEEVGEHDCNAAIAGAKTIAGTLARRSSAEHLIATKALRLHSYGLDAHCR